MTSDRWTPSRPIRRLDPPPSPKPRLPAGPVLGLLIAASFVTASVVGFQVATTPPPAPPRTFTIAVDSTPRGISFKIDDLDGTTPYFGPVPEGTHRITLDSDDRKIHFDTPQFSIVNNDWGTIIVDSATGDYYLLFMETVLGTVNGRACYSRWRGTDWSDLVVLDQQTDDIAFATRAGGGPMRDFIFGRGFVSGSVQIRYGRIP